MNVKAFLKDLSKNHSLGAILINMMLAAFSLFLNGLGIYLTIQANIGVAPWDVLNLGVSRTFGILYGSASITVAFIILVIDILLKEPIGIAMFIDAVVVGKSVDFFNRLNLIPKSSSIFMSIPLIIVGLIVIAYTQFGYMTASLGCGPRDTLLVALAKRAKKVPIGLVSIIMLSTATLVGWLLGGQVGIGTLICAFCAGPIMQFCFHTVRFDATAIVHQHLTDSFRTIFAKAVN